MAKWMIDPGHGGTDSGAVNSKTTEKRMNLIVALELAAHLKNNGEVVYLTRTDDRTLSLAERCQIANAKGVDYFISIHHNSANGTARGMEVIYGRHTPQAFAQKILDITCKGMNQVKRSAYQKFLSNGNDYYAVLRGTNMHAVITEFCFLDTPADYALVDTDLKLKHEAWYIATALLANVGKQINAGKSTTTTNGNTKLTTPNEGATAAVNLVKSREGKNVYTQNQNLRFKGGEGYSDCSALMYWAYKTAYGIDIGTYTEPQSLRGKQVGQLNTLDTSIMRPGDLVFYRGHSAVDKSRPYSIGHVEMYIGGNTLMGHGWGVGPTKKDINTYRREDFCMVRRYYEPPANNTPKQEPKVEAPKKEEPKIQPQAPTVPDKPQKKSKYFSDIPTNHWSIDIFDQAYDLGLVKGIGDGKVGFTNDKAQTLSMIINLYNLLKK